MTAAAKTVKMAPLPWAAATEASRPVSSSPPSAAKTPASVSTANSTRSTRIPAARAASWLPPMAYSERPKRV
jgi:hypothetical protein